MFDARCSRRFQPAILLLAAVPLAAAWMRQVTPEKRDLIRVKMPIHALPTTDGAGNTYTYAESVILNLPNALSHKIAAYGAGGWIWLGPVNWHGAGAVGGDGSTDVVLLPAGVPIPNGGTAFHVDGGFAAGRGAYIEYTNSGGCAGCGMSSASIFFPEAGKELKDFMLLTPPPVPRGLRLRARTANVVRFALPAFHGLPVLGVATYSGPSDYFFAEALFALPKSESELEQFLEGHYVSSCTAHKGRFGC